MSAKKWTLFELWCWRRLLRVPWTAGRSNQSILKEISPQYSLEGLMLKLKFQCSGHLIQRASSLEKTSMLVKMEGKSKKGATEDEMVRWHHWLNGRSLNKLQETAEAREAWCAAVHGVVKSQTQLSNCTTALWPKNRLGRIFIDRVCHLSGIREDLFPSRPVLHFFSFLPNNCNRSGLVSYCVFLLVWFHQFCRKTGARNPWLAELRKKNIRGLRISLALDLCV